MELSKTIKSLRKNYQLWLMIALPLVWLIIFKYFPMYGVLIAFKKYEVSKGVFGSQWVGFQNFIKFIDSYQFTSILINTVLLSIYLLAVSFPFPILLAIALNSARNRIYKKTVQMVTYLPHFISTVVLVGMVVQFLSPKFGLVNHFRVLIGNSPKDFMGDPMFFRSIYVWSAVWQNTGWNAIIYLAALASIDVNLHEAAIIDGANRFKRLLHIDLPGIMPTITIILILNMGKVMQLGFEKVLIMQNPLNIRVSEIIQTYVYKVGIASTTANYSYATAIELFNSFINLFMIIITNQIVKKIGETSLW